MEQDAPPPSVPIAIELSTLLNSFQSTSSDLFSSITNPKKSAAHLSTLHTLDKQLAEVMNTLPRHRSNQARIESLVGEIREHDREWKEGIQAAEKVRRELWDLLEDGKRDCARMGEESPKPDEILSLGRRLAPYTAAPYPMLPHHTASAPYPTEDIMRRGRLGMGGTIDTVGETREVGVEEVKVEFGQQRRVQAGPVATQHKEEEEDPFAFDLDLNPDL